MKTTHFNELYHWYLHGCRRIAIHPLALPAVSLAFALVLIATPSPCFEPEEKAHLQLLDEIQLRKRVAQLHAYHESRNPCDVQERMLLESIDSLRRVSP
ncbi:hypothetical protein GCM10011386_11450 [Parapedobacter defluvii]|uniref:Uncharacterized protein n=1 Tax=Parapedobacter defluvii TaxID=2045106 RepID=A0ABQ1LEL5_9SPHI|nr:hypothetical protein [Parapedobacter defluvii]GGC21221.1 hypothetical protein GCM10011386_11450 [Parapedobacter defluvii]